MDICHPTKPGVEESRAISLKSVATGFLDFARNDNHACTDEFKTLKKFDAGKGREGCFIHYRPWKNKKSAKFRGCR